MNEIYVLLLLLVMILGLVVIFFMAPGNNNNDQAPTVVIEKSNVVNNVTTKTSGDPTVLLASGTLSSAQILKLASDPPVLVPAVPGKIIGFVTGFLRILPGDTPYVSASDGIVLTTNSVVPNATVAFSDQTNFFANATIHTGTLAQIGSDAPDTTGLPLYLSLSIGSPDPVNGNGTCEYFIWYTLS